MARKISRPLTTRGRVIGLLLALPFLLAGLHPIAIGLHWIPIDPAKVHAPGWVLVIVGLVFLSGGLAIVAMVLFPKSNPMTWVSVVLVLGLTAVTHWVAFGDGDRNFRHTRIAGSVRVDMGPVDEATGRRMFAMGAVALDAGILAVGVLLVRKRLSQRRTRGKLQP
jgi:hypothetical protein